LVIIVLFGFVAATLPVREPIADDPRVQPFPTVGLLPKQETGALRFLEQHPQFDGRGVIAAIFDTGVDPGAAGLSTSPQGQPKIVDLIDATGDGDVLMGDAKPAKDCQLEGLSGRTLTIGPGWKNPTGQYRLGLKRAYELFPPELVARLKRERREDWDERQERRNAELRRRLLAWDAKHPKPSQEDKKERDELQARLDVLEQAQKNYDDPGPMYDCVLFHDGDVWRAVIDTDEDGDLSEEAVLADYHREHEFDSFGDISQLNFSVNVYEDGRRLSLVTVSGSHGTHVAGIVAAYEPDHPERNGVAPGAQIVSVKIGDNRIDGMETGRALVRGLRAVIDRECDLINLSYGEPTSTPDRGRLIELFSEVVREHGVIFVASAGNAGPALSTVGAPGGTTDALLGIGAYVSPEMMSPQYGLRETLEGMPYTWTSRGPTTDGALGTDLLAPGGAFSPVPNYELRRSLQANGTSMAAPNACGNIALILSGLKADDTPYTPALVRRALENTAAKLPAVDGFAQGAGLIQTDKAWDWLQPDEIIPPETLAYAVEVGSDEHRGVLLREAEETCVPLETTVTVKPRFREEESKRRHVEFEIPITLETTAEWVDASETMLLTAGEETFELWVDPRQLAEGVHTAEVRAYHAGRESRGPLFRVPVTVLKPRAGVHRAGVQALAWRGQPEGGTPAIEETLELSPGEVRRQFLAVPDGATWLDVELELQEADAARTLVLHTVQTLPGHSFEDHEMRQYVRMEQRSRTVISIPVVGGYTQEIAFAQFWSSLGESRVRMSLRFRGLLPDDDELTLPADGSPLEVAVTSHVRRERCDPSGTLDTLRRLIRPQSVDQEPLLSDRDRQLDGGPTHRLVLTYTFKQPDEGEVTLRIPELDGLLYDSPLEGHEWMLFDANKRLVAVNDMYPDAVSLDEGEYTLRLELRHADADVLEPFEAVPLAVDTELSHPVSVGAFATRADAVAGGESFPATWLDPGEQASVFLTGPGADDLPDAAQPGDRLMGAVHFVDSPDGIEGAKARPGGYPLSFVVPPAANDTDQEPDAETKPKVALAERLKSERVDAMIEQLSELKWPEDQELFAELSQAILEEDAEAKRRVLVARLHLLDDDGRKQRLPEVIAAADEVIATIKQSQLARRLTLRANPDRPQSVRQKEQAEKLRDILVDALYRKGRALAYQELPDVIAQHPIEDQEAHDRAFDENFRELSRWVDTTEKDYYLLHVRRDRRRGQYGKALKLLNQHIEQASPPSRQQTKKRRDLYEQLGWDDWRDYEHKWLLIRFPSDWPPF
jgi:tripeptidyl-peptidase-2